MDKAMTGIISEMGTALSLAQFHLQARSYTAITDLKDQVKTFSQHEEKKQLLIW